MLEYVVGPVLALLLGMKFTHYSVAAKQKKIDELESTVRYLEETTPMKLKAVITPVVDKVNNINAQLGL